MITLIADISERLRSNAYVNEAAVREGIVIPVLRELGWNTADPDQVRPEYTNGAGRADYALFSRRRQIAALIEVKAVGRSLDGDKQLFRYCFEVGAPLAVLTDGRSWNFYLPAGRGSPDERRFYSLQLNERSPAEAGELLDRYLARARVLDMSAFRHAADDYEDAVRRREAVAALPDAWRELVRDANESVIEALLDKAEAMSGYRPAETEVTDFLTSLGRSSNGAPQLHGFQTAQSPEDHLNSPDKSVEARELQSDERTVNFRLFGVEHTEPNASRALVEILRTITKRDFARLPRLSDLVRSRNRSHIARSPEEINPARPDLARGEPIGDGWMVGLTISNRDKMMIIRAACEVYELSIPADLDISLPNA